MQGNREIIQLLNQVLTLELTSINQYFLHARMLRHWGLELLNKAAYKKSIKDMKQADELIERIFFLEGLPNLQHIERLRIGENPLEIFQSDATLEQEQLDLLRQAVAACEKQGDYISRHLLQDILNVEEEYLDWITTQLTLIDDMGLENYLQKSLKESLQ